MGIDLISIRMKGDFLLFLTICFVTLVHGKVEKCKACTSDSLSDPRPECEEDFDDDKVPSTACSEEFGNDFCYVSMIRNKADQSTTWNRGCCSLKAGSNICPINEPDHVSNEVYDQYRARCNTDNCNTMDPRTESGGGGNNHGGIIVHGRNNGAPTLGSSVLLPLTASLFFLLN